MARNIYSGMLLLLAGLLMTACARDDGESPRPSGDETQVTFSLRLPGTASASTRTMTDADEEAVSTADVFVFDDTGKLVDIGYGYGITDQSTPTDVIKNFNVTLQIGTARDIMILINSREMVKTAYPSGVPLDGTETKTTLQNALTMTVGAATGWNADPSDPGYKHIPMWGERRNIDINGSTQLTGANAVKVTRMVARVGVFVDGSIPATEFRLTSVRLYNYNTCGQFIPFDASGNWTAATPYATDPSLPAVPGRTTGPLTYPSADGRKVDGDIYLFEAAKGVPITDPVNDYMENVCLVLGGHYDGSGTETFYRVDFVKRESDGTVTYLDILRNHNYKVTITGVNGPGKPNEDDAFASYPDNIDAGIVVWNDADMEDVWFDGQYYYSVSPLDKVLEKDASTGNTIKIRTDYPKWSYEISESPTPGNPSANPSNFWLKVTSSHLPGVEYPGTVSGDHMTYDVEDNNTGSDRVAYVHVTAGRFVMAAKVTQQSSYITSVTVSPTGEIAAAGETRTVTITGDFQNTLVRAWDATNYVQIGTDQMVPAGLVGTASLAIPEYGWHPTDITQKIERTVAFEYYSNILADWRLIRSEDQEGYYVNISSDHVHDVPFPGMGDTYTVEVWGNFTEIQLRSYDQTNNVALDSGTTVPAGSATVATPAISTISVPYNASLLEREVLLQYSVDGGMSWIILSSGVQDIGNPILSSGRIVAKELLLQGNPVNCTWTWAMGIDDKYLTQYYWSDWGGTDITNTNYVPTNNTGCAAYSETSSDMGKWFLPDRYDLWEMMYAGYLPHNGDNIANAATWYWSRVELSGNVNNAETMRIRYDGTINAVNLRKNQTLPNLTNGRCVREP